MCIQMNGVGAIDIKYVCGQFMKELRRCKRRKSFSFPPAAQLTTAPNANTKLATLLLKQTEVSAARL